MTEGAVFTSPLPEEDGASLLASAAAPSTQTKAGAASGAGCLRRQAINQRHVSLSIYRGIWQHGQRTILAPASPPPPPGARCRGVLPKAPQSVEGFLEVTGAAECRTALRVFLCTALLAPPRGLPGALQPPGTSRFGSRLSHRAAPRASRGGRASLRTARRKPAQNNHLVGTDVLFILRLPGGRAESRRWE